MGKLAKIKTPASGYTQMTDFDLDVEAVASRKVKVKRDGSSEAMSATEAVLQKQLLTAMGGSPHAQHQFLRNVERAAEIRRKIRDEDIGPVAL